MILLIQFRTDQSGWHEVRCIYEAGNLDFHEYTIVNAANKTISPTNILILAEDAKLVILGGAGEGGYEASTAEEKDYFQTIHNKMMAVIPTLIEQNIPTIGMCFGHQLIADALDAPIEINPDVAETGIAKICLTDAGKQDPLLEKMDACFPAVVGHKASVLELPDQATLLARSQTCEIQAFRYQENIYGFQFHPELNKQTLQDRLEMYPVYKDHEIDSYTEKPITADRITKQAIDQFV